jgi:hypothetical protein
MIVTMIRLAGVALAFSFSSSVAGISDSLIKILDVIPFTMMHSPKAMAMIPSVVCERTSIFGFPVRRRLDTASIKFAISIIAPGVLGDAEADKCGKRTVAKSISH